MSNEQLMRNYKMTDSELTAFTQHVCDSMTRDTTEFTAFGILAVDVNDLQAKCDAFEVFPTDDYVNQELLSAILSRDNILTELKAMVKAMAMRVELKWGKKSPKYVKLGISDMSKITVESFTTRARMVLAFMTEYLTELSSAGLTQILLDDMEAKAQQLDDAVRNVLEKSSYRMEKTTERITKGNELYKLMSKYCEVGKRSWDKINPVYFNDYVIYDYSGGVGGTGDGGGGGTVPAAPTNLGLDTMTMNFYWDQVENATSYQLETSVAGVEWEEIYSGSDSSIYYFPPVAGLMQYRVKARNSNGYGPSSGLMMYNYPGELAAPDNLSITVTNVVSGAITLTWSEVDGATYYKLYGCSVATGAPALLLIDFSYAGEFNVATFSGVGGTGNRRYYYVKAGNSERVSVASEVVFVDL
ncbi:MAG: hypothetical protein RO257_17870 [Candidatus Kapabacteria bacterium]|jgi:hypothetical protein|nr:hypothetical protein [Candidatus Kapabacteria bacterium]